MSIFIKRMSVMCVLIVGVLLIFATVTQAQQQRMSVEERVKILKDSLLLSDDQAAKITKILEDQREEMTTARNENKGDRSAMRAAVQEIMKKSDNQIKDILTDEQTKKYNEMQKARRSQMDRRTRGSGK